MRTRALGPSGIEASVVVFGAWAIGGWMWGGTDEKESIRTIHAALDAGINAIDTAPVYGFGTSEKIVGKALKGRREDVVVMTKCGLVWDTEQGDFHFHSDEEKMTDSKTRYSVYKYLAPQSIRTEIERSLTRLNTDYIDLYQTHWQDSTTPIEDSMAELLKLKDEGKIRAIGVSNVSVKQLDEYRSAGVIDSDQEKFSMLDREHMHDLLPYCAESKMAFLAYSPLAQGLLTGKVTPEREFSEGDQRRDKERFSVENRKKVMSLLDAFRPIAEKHEASLAQIALAWTLEQRGCSHVLAGTRKEEQARDNAGAGTIILSREELDSMNKAVQAHAPAIQ